METRIVLHLCHLSASRQGIPFARMAEKKPCPDGTEIATKERCEEALKYASSLGFDGNKKILVSSENGWPKQPLKCSVGTDLFSIKAEHQSNQVGRLMFNQGNTSTVRSNERLNNGEVAMLCEAGKFVNSLSTALFDIIITIGRGLQGFILTIEFQIQI